MSKRAGPTHPIPLRNVRTVTLEVHPDPEVDFIPHQWQGNITVGVGKGIESKSKKPNLILKLQLAKGGICDRS